VPDALAANERACKRNADKFERPHFGCIVKENSVKPEELKKLDAYFKRIFGNSTLIVKPRPKKDDSAELFLGEEFLGLIYRDDEDGDLSYNFSMAILDMDLE
jgi:Protein of unknown function (DUF3126)